MARFLSPEWFGELSGRGPDGGSSPPDLVVEIVVSGTPDGEVRYQVMVCSARARVLPPGTAFWPAQVELHSDYATMAGIASGRLSAQDALSAGRARVSGDTAALPAHLPGMAGLDLMAPEARASTTF